jgi:hypothetical protein
VTEHLDTYTKPGPDALIFTGPKSAQLRRSNFSRQWSTATASTGLSGFHFHDLRHTGNQLANDEGAGLRELMDRMGHSSTRAALIYQHRSRRRDQRLADAIEVRVKAERSGTHQRHDMTLTVGRLGVTPLTCGFGLERVTRIELALSAWESEHFPA